MQKSTASASSQLTRGLHNRHVQLIAFGGAIGVGLFLGSAGAIEVAGPAALLAYVVGGAVVYFVARALGELLLYRPVAGAFTAYADEFLGPWAGFVTGWSYWILWILAGITEITAVGIYVRVWLPEIPQWIPALATLAALTGVNLVSAKLFGEFEFWFALVKVVTIVLLIVFGIAILVFGFGDLGRGASVGNLWSHGGFAPKGWPALLLALPIAVFSFGGVEVIGVTAGETDDPERSLPRAIRSVAYRIILFYVGALAVILCLIPWNDLSARGSPFVLVFQQVGLPAAAAIINLVVITAAASGCSTGTFAAGRMLHAMAGLGRAPRYFSELNSAHVPARGIITSAAMMLIGVIANYLVPDRAFAYATSIVVVTVVWTWMIILLAHLRYRAAVERGAAKPVAFRMPGAPYTNWIVLGILLMTFGLLAASAETRVAVYATPIWFLLLTVCYRIARLKTGAVR